LQDLLLDAGRTIIEQEGLNVGAGDLTFKRVFDHLEATTGVHLTNASVIRRVWDNQEEFQTDVLVAIASTTDSAGELERTVEVVAPMMASFDLSSPEARIASMSELSRVGGEISIRARLETRDWSLWVGVWVLALTTELVDRRILIRRALDQGLEDVTVAWEGLFTGVCAAIGIRVRAPLTLRQFTVAATALAEGSALRQGGDPDLERIVRPTGPLGAPQEWTLFGVCLEALALRFFEIDPDWPGVPSSG
jgi:hypothetical protein